MTTTDPAALIHRAANEREQRIKALAGNHKSRWFTVQYPTDDGKWLLCAGNGDILAAFDVVYEDEAAADHTAAEADPAHALAEVALWRGIAERHRSDQGDETSGPCCQCCGEPHPCPDLLDGRAAAAAYLGETT